MKAIHTLLERLGKYRKISNTKPPETHHRAGAAAVNPSVLPSSLMQKIMYIFFKCGNTELMECVVVALLYS